MILIICFSWVLSSIFIISNLKHITFNITDSSINDVKNTYPVPEIPDFIKEYSKSDHESVIMPLKWLDMRHKLKQTYNFKNTQIKGFTHQEVIDWNKEAIEGNELSLGRSDDLLAVPSTHHQLSITQILPEFEVAELSTGKYPEVWFIRYRSIYMYLYLYLYCTLYFVPEILTQVQ